MAAGDQCPIGREPTEMALSIPRFLLLARGDALLYEMGPSALNRREPHFAP